MKTNIAYFIVSLALLSLQACVKPFMPKLENSEQLLVVDGFITDAPGPYTVKLSRSARLLKVSEFIPYGRCKVTIADNKGHTVLLSEHAPGVYQTDSLDIRGVPGTDYKLMISTPEGEEYESSYQPLLKGIGIQSAYAELEHKNDPLFPHGRDGYQFYVDTEHPPVSDNYLLWRVQSTYKFRTDFAIYAYYDNGMHDVDYNDTLRTCYRTRNIPEFYIFKTGDLASTGVRHFPLNYEDNYSKALSMRYSLNVHQYTINKEAYTYWSTLKKMSEQQGELYTQQPYQVANNLTNLTHPEKPALGYFMAAGLVEKRIFVDPPLLVWMRYEVCVMDSMPPVDNPLKWIVKTPSAWPVFFTRGYSGELRLLSQECLDCRLAGGVLPKPSFWID